MNPTATAVRSTAIRDLVALTKPRITLLNLIATAAGFAIAPGAVGWGGLLLTLLGTGLVVGSANALNCYLERDSDKAMARTRSRPLPSGRLQASTGLLFGLALSAVGVPLLTVAVNPLAGLLSSLALVVYVLLYTPMKSRSSAALLVGAVPGAAPPAIGWAAATGALDLTAVLLFALLFLWQIPHFLAITLFRKADYQRAGLKTLPEERGDPATRQELVRYLLATVATSLSFAMAGTAGLPYLVAAVTLALPMVALALKGLSADAGPRWARNFFLATNLYLPALLAALVVDHVIG